MSKIQNDSGKTSVEEFSLDEMSGANQASIIARAQARRAENLFAEDSKPTAKSASAQSGGESSDSGIMEFKFLECDPITIDGRPAPECPFCTKDPMAYVSDYTTMFPGEVFYDARQCTYCISMEVAPQNLGGPTVEQLNNDEGIKNDIKRIAINRLLEAYNKSKEATVYYYLEDSTGTQNLAVSIGAGVLTIVTAGLSNLLTPDEVPGYTLIAEQRDVVEELLPYTTLDYTVPVQLKARTKLKISIDSQVFFRAPANAIAEPETPFETGGYEVTLKGKSFSRFGDIYKVRKAMESYDKQFIRWQAMDGGRLRTVTGDDQNLGIFEKFNTGGVYYLDLKKEAKMLKKFKSHIVRMLDDSGFKNMKNIENITFKFEPIGSGDNPEIKLKQIVMNKFGCPDVTFAEDIALTKSKFEWLMRKDEFKRTTTLYYIGSLPDMHADVVAREPLPWLEFLLKYTYPNLQVDYGGGSDNLTSNPTGLNCLVESVLDGDGAVEELLKATLDELLSFPDVLSEEFSKNLCLTPEQLDKQDQDLGERLTRETAKTYEAEKNKITRGNPYFEKTFENIERRLGAAGDPQKKKQVIYEEALNPLGYCGWIALIMKALECVGKGLPIADFKKVMVEAAMDAMDDGAFQKMLIGLPPDAQKQLADNIAGDLSGLPAPWDTQSYQVGNYPGSAFSKDPIYTEDHKMKNEDYALAKEKHTDAIDAINAAKEDGTMVGALKAVLLDDYGNTGENLVEVGNKEFPGSYPKLTKDEIIFGTAMSDTSTGTSVGLLLAEVGYDGEDFNFGEQSKGSGGTYGTALGNIQKDVFDAYKNQALKSLDIDLLLNEMGRLPGAPIIAGFLTSLPCKPTPLWAFDPRLDSFMNTIEFDFCQIPEGDWFDITTPKWAGANVGWSNIWKAFVAAVEEALENLLVKLAMQAIKSLLKWVLNLACDSLALLGASLGDLFTGSDKFSDLLAAEMCPDQDPETVNEALLDLFGTFGGLDASCFSGVTGDEMGAFIDDLSMMLNQDQVCALLKGTADAETLRLAAEVARASANECIAEVFSSEDMIESLFAALGKLLPVDEICADSAGAVPATDCPPDTLAAIEELRCELLSSGGLTPEECRDELDKLKDALLAAAKELADLMQNGPYGNLPPLIGDGCTEGIIAAENPLMDQVVGAVSGMVLSPIETGVITDMFGRVTWWAGRGGFFNTVLSDTKGRPWKGHNFMVRFFGAPLSEQQGFMEFHSDDAIKNPESEFSFIGPFGYRPYPLNIYGKEMGEPGNFADYGAGGFPPTVAAWLAKQYRELDPAFKTVTIPIGYSSKQAAEDDIKEKTALRSANLESRKKYVEAFIVANNLENPNSHKDAIALTNILRKTVQTSFGDLFIDGASLDDEPSGLSAEQKVTRQVLVGKGSDEGLFNLTKGIRCCSDMEGVDISLTSIDLGLTDGVEIYDGEGTHPRDWPHGAQEQAGTDGKAWADWALSEFGDTVPVEIPNATTSDLYIPYVGYATEEEPLRFSVGYDYNLFEDGESIKKGGDYRIRIIKGTPADETLNETAFLLDTHNLLVESGILPEVQIVLDNLPLSETVSDSWQMETFYRLISEVIINNSTSTEDAITATNTSTFRDYFAGTGEGSEKKYDSISSGFIKRIANRIAVGKSYPEPNVTLEAATADDFLAPPEGEVPEKEESNVLDFIAPSFKFGYDPGKQPNIIKLDNETYGGPLAQLFPDVFPPPFYVQPPEYTGWFDLVDALMPAPDGCEPPGSLFFDLSDLQSLPSQVANNLIEDPRLNYDALCSQESPYDKIYPNMTIGSLEMIMRATTRIYLSSTFLKSLPVVSQFALNTENYDEGLFEYIAQDMKYGLKESGRRWTGKSSNEYYYRFLEQVVNVTARKVVSGMIDPETDFTEEEKEAYDIIAAKVLSFYENNDGELAALSTTAISQQTFIRGMLSNGAADSIAGLGAGSAAFNKKAAENAKDAAFDLMIYETEDQATVFLKRMIREEMDAMGKIFNERLLQPVQNIDHLFLLSTTWIRGGLNGDGPIDVISDPTDPNKYKIPSGLPGTTGGLAEKFAESLGSAFADMDEWPFVLEKYIRIIEKDTPNALGRTESGNLYGVVNINDWDVFVAQAANNNSGNISDFWGEHELSSETTMVNEHIHTYDLDENGNGKTMAYLSEAGEAHYHEIINFEMQDPIAGEAPTSVLTRPDDTSGGPLSYTGGNHVHELDMPAWRFGLRICYMPEKDKTGIFTNVIKEVSASTIMQEKAFKVQSLGGERVLIPIASAEINIPDQDFSLFDPESYDVYCLIQDLIDTPTYKTWFRYVFPLPRFITILAIYNDTVFMDSLGNTGMPEDGGDMWEKKGGNNRKGFRRWDKTEMFAKSRKEARKAFRSVYQTTQPDYSSDRELYEKPATSFLEMMRPLLNFDDGLSWWQRGRRIKIKPEDLC